MKRVKCLVSRIFSSDYCCTSWLEPQLLGCFSLLWLAMWVHSMFYFTGLISVSSTCVWTIFSSRKQNRCRWQMSFILFSLFPFILMYLTACKQNSLYFIMRPFLFLLTALVIRIFCMPSRLVTKICRQSSYSCCQIKYTSVDIAHHWTFQKQNFHFFFTNCLLDKQGSANQLEGMFFSISCPILILHFVQNSSKRFILPEIHAKYSSMFRPWVLKIYQF